MLAVRGVTFRERENIVLILRGVVFREVLAREVIFK